MIDLILIVAGIVLAFVTKNKRWLVLTLLGIVIFVADVLFVAAQLAGL